MNNDKVDELVELEREICRERELSLIWWEVVCGARPLHGVQGVDRDRELFRPLDTATHSRLVDLVCTAAPAAPAPTLSTPSYLRRWGRITAGIGVLAAAAGFAVYLNSAPSKDDSLQTLALTSPPEVSILGGGASTRATVAVPFIVRPGAEAYEVDERREFQIEVRAPGETLAIRRILARCSEADTELHFAAPITTKGLTVAKIVPSLAPGELCSIEMHFEFHGRLLRLPDELTPQIRVAKAL